MKLHHEDNYVLPVADLFAVFTDKAFYEARFNSAHSETEFVEFGPRGGRFIIDVRRHVRVNPESHIPAIARRFVRDVNVLHTVIEWDLSKGDSHRGVHRFQIEGVPVEVTGSMHLEPRAAGSANRMELNIKCTIPLIGGKIADLVGERAKKSLVKDHKATLKYLREHGLIPA